MTSFYGGGVASTSGGGSTPTPIKGALIFKGTLGISDDGATVLVLPDEHEEGWTYLVVTAGTYAEQLCEKGDFVICVSSGEAASDLDWTVVQGNTFNTLPTPTALDEGKIISVDTSGNYVLIDNPSSGETENLPDPSEADEGKILSVGADGNYILTDNPAKDKLDKANPTYTGSLTGENATFTGSVQVSTPDQDNEAANKSYVDTALADAKNYTDSEITNLENGTTELPYIKNNGDTVTGSYDLTGAAVTIAEPASNNSPATKKYVDDSISAIDVSEQIAPLTERVTAAEGEIDTLQTDVEAVETSVANITNGTTELPYVKDSGDTVTGTYNFTGANVTIAEPTVSNNPATKNYVDAKIASAGGSGEVVSYTQGNGINISPENIISVVIAADNANGLAVDTNGIKLNVATPTTAGAMSGADKAKLDASSTTEQMNQAISSAIDETLEDPTKLPFVNINGDTMHGSLTTTELFTDFVTIRNAGTDGNTGFQNNSDTDHIRVYDKVADTLVPIEVGEPVNNQDASTKKYVDDKVTIETAARAEAIESLNEAKADKDNPTFTGIISGANATLSGTLTGNTATFSGGITVPLEPGAEGSATSKKYVDDQIAAIDIEPLTQKVTAAEGEIDTLQSDMTTVKSNVETINTNITNITNGTTKLPYVTKEEVEIAADTRDVARAYRYTFNDGLDGTNSNAGFGFIDFTPAIVTEVDGSTGFSPLYIGEPKKDSQATTKKYVDEAIAAVDAPEYTLAKQAAAEDGYFATYYLTKDGAQVGEKINIPKDYLVKEAELLEVAATDTPYSGAVIGDKYIDFTINTQASDEDEQHIYLPVKDLVDVYTGGNGININASNVVSVQIDAANANGLAVGSAGLKLNLATTSAAGAMSAADKTKLNTAVSEEQLTAVENEIDTLQTEVNNIKSGTTDLGYLKAANPTYTGTLNGVNATFTGDVIVPTPDGDTEAANKSYVDSAIDTTETALREDISEVQQSVMQQTGTIDILSQTITGITQGTVALPYVKKDELKEEVVLSVNDKSGEVKLVADSLPFNNIGTPFVSTTVQDAIEELLSIDGVAVSVITVTAPASAVVTIQKGAKKYIQTVDEDGTELSFKVLETGEWSVAATLGEQKDSGSVTVLEAGGTYNITLDFAPYRAYIKVTAPDGATVKATKGDKSVAGQAFSGSVTLTVNESGEWTITATYKDGVAQAATANVLEEGETYAVEAKFATLTVTAPVGSTVEIKNGVTTLSDTADSGSIKFWLPNTGTWSVTAELDGQTASDSIECYAYQAYSTSLSYFSATIKVAAVQGATVKAVLDGHTVSGEAGSGGVVTLTVLHPGSYTVSATYKNALSNSKAVQVSQSGREYTVSVEFITLTVTAPAGSTITAKNGATTLTDTGGSVKFYLPNTGAWTVSATLNGNSTSSEVQCNAYQDYSVELAYIPETLNDCTWAQIHELSAAGKLGDYYDVGDGKDITLNGTVGILNLSNLVITAFVLGIDHNPTLEGYNKTHFALGRQGGKQVALCDSQYNDYTSSTCFHMNSSDDNGGGWNQSYMRKTILGNSGSPSSPPSNSLLAALPADLRAVMQSVNKYTDNTGHSGNSSGAVTATQDYMFLLAEFEAYGRRTYANQYEQNSQQQYDYFKAGNAKLFYNHGSTGSVVWAWSRSPLSHNTGYFVIFNADGTADYDSAGSSGAVCAGFAV